MLFISFTYFVSNVYGSDPDVAMSLRESQGGRLLVNRHKDRDMLPEHPRAPGCRRAPPFCFKAGEL